MYVEPTWEHEGDESWFEDEMVTVAGHLYPRRFRISIRCDASQVELCIGLEICDGGFTEQVGGTTVHGVTSDLDRDQVRTSVRKLALPLALTMVPLAVRKTEKGWEWTAEGWSAPPLFKVGDHLPGHQLTLLKELRRRTGRKWCIEYLPRIHYAASIVREAQAEKSMRRVIEEDVCPQTCVGRTQAYQDLQAARELGWLPASQV
ncbi:hypothetical protein ACIQZN_08745 [Streptomyces sp. NPDC097595]|uniref:hypothetical protein n=1 Tax=Streptomyces sp. NPDC097595 TaxID=3366090 RepID=UPI0037FA60A5